ncbi:MAG: 50S ribosomal protein L22 [Rhodospirillaceae bacterium]|jgi:large subunit ribosomal protein L22|nr:50S ribosomal protein L22 [Rhodospirillaceae bacterium]
MSKKSAQRRYKENEAMAFSKAIRISPQKLNLVASLIRGKEASEALANLTFSPKRVAYDVKRVLESAIANAENNHQLDVDRLYVSEASVGRAFALKRFRPRARGRTGSITKPFSNLTVVVREREEAK